MRLSNFLVGMLACAAITACSNDTDSIIDNPTPNPTGNAYMAINLTMGGGAGTKATTDGGNDYGTENEGAVKVSDAFFYFYDAQGNYLTTGTISTTNNSEQITDGYLKLTPQSSDPSEGNIERESSPIVVLGPTEIQPAQVLAVLNAGSTNLLAGKNLTDAVAYLQDNSADIADTKGSFIMTNSVYVNDNKIINAQAITADNIKQTPTEAIATGVPVNIYVERAAAKVSLKTSNDAKEFELKDISPILDGSEISMKVVIDGWCINAYNQDTYLVKNLDNSWATSAPITNWTGWSSAANYRSYWAKDCNYSGSGNYHNGPTYKGLTYKAWKDATIQPSTSASPTKAYCYENTVDPSNVQAAGEQYANVTTVLIAAHVETKSGTESNYKKQDLFKKSGVYYTKSTWLQNIISSCNYYWYDEDATGEKWIALSASDFETDDYTITESTTSTTAPATVTINFTDIKDKEGYTLVQGSNGTSNVDENQVLTALNSAEMTKNVEGYKDGKCYYQVPIEQLATGLTATTVYGVVRNHSYVLTVSGISEVGYPVYNEDAVRPVIPGKDKDYYVACTLNILAWQTVEQTVEL